jgi:hypothetical protein
MQLACDINWGEVALIDQFRCGFRDDVQDLLLTFADPSSLNEAITQAIVCSNIARKRKSPLTPNFGSVTLLRYA